MAEISAVSCMDVHVCKRVGVASRNGALHEPIVYKLGHVTLSYPVKGHWRSALLCTYIFSRLVHPPFSMVHHCLG